MGSGPQKLTVLFYLNFNTSAAMNNRIADELEQTRQYVEYTFRDFHTGEQILFLVPPSDLSSLAWRLAPRWDVQRTEGGDVVVVHPSRDLWRERNPDGYTRFRSILEQTLPAFTAAVRAAHQEWLEEFNGFVVPPADYPELPLIPMIARSVGQLSDYYAVFGSMNPVDPPPPCALAMPGLPDESDLESLPDVDAALNAVYGSLRRDCRVLLAAKEQLQGDGTLNWSVDTPVADWDGVTVGTPQRVTVLNLANEGLTGSIPEGLAGLDGLTELRLTGNSLTGCTPPGLSIIETTDLPTLIDCPTPPTGLAGTTTDSAMALTWNAVAVASKYRVESWDIKQDVWTVASDAVTGVAHTVTGLRCERVYRARVSSYGDGTAAAAAWGAPSEYVILATAACIPPVFEQESYAFSIREDLAPGDAVGAVTATDNSGEVTYAITAGNDAGKFAIGESTGAITVAGDLIGDAGSSFTLTVEAEDESGGAATVPVTVEVTETCDSGTAVSNPTSNSDLVSDCETLLGLKDDWLGRLR